MPRQPNWRRVKLNRPYTYDELAKHLGISKGTVRNWVRHQGLRAITEKRPHLILAEDARDFLRARQTKRKTKMKLDEMYCFSCKVPRVPAGRMVDCCVSEATTARLQGLCPVCETIMNKRASRVRIDELHRIFEVAIKRA